MALGPTLWHAAAATGQLGEPPGRRLDLTVGRLCVPDGYESPPEGVHVVVHLHGASWAAERALAESGWRAVVVSVVLNGLSAVYAAQFRDPEVFRTVLAEAQAALPGSPAIRRVTVTSFSAGFGGVRELLKHEDLYRRIDTLVMADSIHAGFVGDPARREVGAEAMAGFLRFARDAEGGSKRLVVSHSAIRPDSYASTTETADYLLSQLGGQRQACSEEWAAGLVCTSRFERGGLGVYGFAGDTGPDHMRHLHRLGLLMRKVNDG